MTGPVLVVVGLKREAAIAAGEGVATVCGGGRSDLLATRIAQAIAEHAPRAVLSFGVAGALQPGLPVGAVLAAAVVRDGARRRFGDPAWTARLVARTAARLADFAGVDAVAADPADKARLRETTGAAVVDMESHLAARAAQDAGLPFAALRVVSDRAEHGLPAAAVAGMGEDGGVDVGAVLRALARDPRQLSALLRTGRDAGMAFRALAKVRRAAGVRFGWSEGGRA